MRFIHKGSPYLRVPITLLSAAAGFFLVNVFARPWLPEPPLPHIVREKIARLAEHGDDYDTIFLGSSRIQNHAIPSLFDEITSANGRPTKSFNFGISSLRAPEDEYLLDLILAQPHGHLRWLFVEIDFFQTDIAADREGTLEGLYWHDWRRFSLLCHRLALSRHAGFKKSFRSLSERSRDFQDHAKLFVTRAAHIGQGAQRLHEWLFDETPAPLDSAALGKAGDGWLAAQPSAHNLADIKSGKLAAALKERTVSPPKRDLADDASQEILAAFLERCTAAGVTPIIVIPPRAREFYFYPRADLAERYAAINFCDPRTYPDLYREDLRVDASHLTEDGAKVFTKELAGKFLEIRARGKD